MAEHETYFPTEKARRIFFSYWRCGECRGLYCPVYFNGEQLVQLYMHQNENMVDVPLSAREATQAGYVDLLRRYAPMRGNYMELGADIGLFTQHCVAAGQFENGFLYEPNKATHAALRQRVANPAFRITSDLYQAGMHEAASLDLAVLIHVLDHLLDPHAMLEQLMHDLKPGGYVFIVTHNEKSLLAKVLGKQWPPYTLQHPQLYSPASMRKLLTHKGFEVVTVQGCANVFPLHYLVRRAAELVGLEGLFGVWNSSPNVRLNLGNIATLCRKPL